MDKKNNTTVKMVLKGAVSVVILLLSLALFRNQEMITRRPGFSQPR